MATKLKRRDQRALLALGAALALFALLEFGALESDSTSSASSSYSIEALEQRLLLAQVKVRQRADAVAELAALERALESVESGVLTSADANLAQAEMRSLVGDLLTAEGIEMRASRFGRVELLDGDYVEIPLVVDFNCGIEQFVNLMAAIANSPRLLTTRLIRISPENQEVKSVRLRLTVAGYLPVERTPELTEKAGEGVAGL